MRESFSWFYSYSFIIVFVIIIYVLYYISVNVGVIADHINTVSLFLSFNLFLPHYFYLKTPPMSWDRHDFVMLKLMIRFQSHQNFLTFQLE